MKTAEVLERAYGAAEREIEAKARAAAPARLARGLLKAVYHEVSIVMRLRREDRALPYDPSATVDQWRKP